MLGRRLDFPFPCPRCAHSVTWMHPPSTEYAFSNHEPLFVRDSPTTPAMDAHELLQLAADDGLYTNVAALLTSPHDQLMQPAPDVSFAWSPCSYALTTTEGAWPTSIYTEAPLSISMERLPLVTASGWSWHKNHQLPRLAVSCGAR